MSHISNEEEKDLPKGQKGAFYVLYGQRQHCKELKADSKDV